MAVVENAVPNNTASSQNYENAVVSSDSNGAPPSDLINSKPSRDDVVNVKDANFDHQNDHSINANYNNNNGFDAGHHKQHVISAADSNGQVTTNRNGNHNRRVSPCCSGGLNDMTDLVEILSNLNPMAEEFVPPSLSNSSNNTHAAAFSPNGSAFPTNYVPYADHGHANGLPNRRKKNNFSQGRRRMNTRTSMAQREEIIRRTVYVSDIDQQVTEEQLASLFIQIGQVVDCRICGDPNSVLRFAFIEFMDEESARAALSLSGTVLGYYPVKVLPSKTAIAPVNPTFLPRSEDEREMCARTVYCTNIDKKVTQVDLRSFFEAFCGEVHRLRLLGDYHHSTRIAFVEFAMADSAIAALSCSGAILGSLPIRVSPSKTPVRPRIARSQLH